MRVHAPLAIATCAALVLAIYLSGAWAGVASRDSLLAGPGAIAALLNQPSSPTTPLPPLPLAVLRPFGPATDQSALTWPAVLVAIIVAALVAIRPERAGHADRHSKKDFIVNPKDGTVLLRTGAGFNASLAAFERTVGGSLSFQALVSNPTDHGIAQLRLMRQGTVLGQIASLGPGELKVLELSWGTTRASVPSNLQFQYAYSDLPEVQHKLSVSLPWSELIDVFERENSLIVVEPAPLAPVTPTLAQPVAVPVGQPVTQVRDRQRVVLEKLRKRAEEERKAAEGLVERVSFQPSIPELPPGISMLIEGPISSKKAEMVAAIAKRSIEGGRGVAWCSFDPNRDLEVFEAGQRRGIMPVQASIPLEETGISISKLVAQKPSLSVFDLLYRYTPKYLPEMLLKFIAFNLSKLREASIASIWPIESTLDPQVLASIEGEFDAVIEFVVREERGELRSYFRTKKFKGVQFSTELRRWG